MTDDERTELAIQRHQELSLLAHQQAQAAINAVSAEICENCGNEIPELRRLSVPGCQLCVDCKAVEEREAGRLGREY